MLTRWQASDTLLSMNIKPITTAQMESALATANKAYDGNLTFKTFVPQNNGGVHFTLTVRDSKAPGARRSHTGRRIAAACWHAHRDFMAAIFDLAPDAVLRSYLAVYKGKSGFERDYPATGYANISSIMQPMEHRHACDC